MMLVMAHSATCLKVASFLKFFMDLNGTGLAYNFQIFIRGICCAKA